MREFRRERVIFIGQQGCKACLQQGSRQKGHKKGRKNSSIGKGGYHDSLRWGAVKKKKGSEKGERTLSIQARRSEGQRFLWVKPIYQYLRGDASKKSKMILFRRLLSPFWSPPDFTVKDLMKDSVGKKSP